MLALSSLWLPILVSAVVVFLASFALHMLIPLHRHDYAPLPSEAAVLEALRSFSIPPGDYMVPRAEGPDAMRDPVFLDKMKRGPVFVATFMKPGRFTMGPQLAQWFVYCVVVGIFVAYLTTRTLAAGTDYLHVFQIAGSVAFIAYAMGLWQNSIWYQRSWATTIRYTIDGLIYGALTAGVFGWLWPR